MTIDTKIRRMIESKGGSKKSKAATVIGSVFLIIMALFHGSGINYVTDIVRQSNSESLIKEIFPVLFAHPSVHLLGLAALGIVSLYMGQDAKKVLLAISSLVVIDAFIAFYMSASIPGVLLLVSAFCFFLGGIQRKA